MNYPNRFLSELARHEYSVDFTLKGPYTICEIDALVGTRHMKVFALSTCSPRDKYNEELGKSIALGRAAKKLTKRLRKVQPDVPTIRILVDVAGVANTGEGDAD